MPVYISLNQLTDKGIQSFRESPLRLDAAKKTLEDSGCKLLCWYLTMGKYDAVFIIECPDDKTMAAITLDLGSQGNMRTQTLKAFTEDEYRSIIDRIK